MHVRSPELGRVAPESIIGIHVNAATVGFQPFCPVPEEVQTQLTDQEWRRLIYYEGRKHAESGWLPLTNSQVPTAVARFSGDTAIRRRAEEAPDLLTRDIREFFRSLR